MALCSTSQSPLSHFSKHVQVDRALQSDRFVRDGSRQNFRDTRGDHAEEEFAQFDGLPNPIPSIETQQMILGSEGQQLLQTTKGASRDERDIWLSEFSAHSRTAATNDIGRTRCSPVDYTSFQYNLTQSAPKHTPVTKHGFPSWIGRRNPVYKVTSSLRSAIRGPDSQFNGSLLHSMSSRQDPVSFEARMADSEWEALFAQLEATSNPINLEDSKETIKTGQTYEIPMEEAKEDIEIKTSQPATHQTSPHTIDYEFETDNPFTGIPDPFEQGMEIVQRQGNLYFAALAFEAACQQKPTHFSAWFMLGTVQAESEREATAIQSLTEALKLQPENLEVMMALAVCYTNEGHSHLACDKLWSWLQVKYPQIAHSEPDIRTTIEDRHSHLKTLFIRAAQLSPEGEAMDPDVQVALGILFFSTRSYQLAGECFAAAITSVSASNPHLHQLWTRYGACLGNLNSASGFNFDAAKTAYLTAIRLSPNSLRARYNLAALQYTHAQPRESARTLLHALKVSKADMLEIVTVGTSHGRLEEMLSSEQREERAWDLYELLRRCCCGLSRWDLAEVVRPGVDLRVLERELEVNEDGDL